MIAINGKLFGKTNLKNLNREIQGALYRFLPAKEHEGYTHAKSGKIFKKTNFDWKMKGDEITIRFSSIDKALEESVIMGIIRDGLFLGTTKVEGITFGTYPKRVDKDRVVVRGNVVVSAKSLLDKKIYIEPQHQQHLNSITTNALQRYETFFNKEYEGPFEIKLLWQSMRPSFHHYGNNNEPAKSWRAVWEIHAKPELINMLLDGGFGSYCMSYGVGFLEEIEKKDTKDYKELEEE